MQIIYDLDVNGTTVEFDSGTDAQMAARGALLALGVDRKDHVLRLDRTRNGGLAYLVTVEVDELASIELADTGVSISPRIA